MNGYRDCPADKAKSENVAAADRVPGQDFPPSNTAHVPTCTGAQGLFVHTVLQKLKDIQDIRSITWSKAHTHLQERSERVQRYLLS